MERLNLGALVGCPQSRRLGVEPPAKFTPIVHGHLSGAKINVATRDYSAKLLLPSIMRLDRRINDFSIIHYGPHG
jgi:hypothetical protein